MLQPLERLQLAQELRASILEVVACQASGCRWRQDDEEQKLQETLRHHISACVTNSDLQRTLSYLQVASGPLQ